MHQWGSVQVGDNQNFHISFTLQLNKITILSSSPASGEGIKKTGIENFIPLSLDSAQVRAH